MKTQQKVHKSIFLKGAITFVTMLLFISCSTSPNKVVTAAADGTVYLTAENGEGLGPEIQYMPDWKAFGWFTAKDSVVWIVEIENPGQYEVELEWSVSDEEAGKPFVFYSGNQRIEGIVQETGSWETFQKDKIGTIRLAAGKQTLVFKPAGDFEEEALLDLRALTLVPVR